MIEFDAFGKLSSSVKTTLLADTSFDIWSLGIVFKLFQFVNSNVQLPFETNKIDNISDANLEVTFSSLGRLTKQNEGSYHVLTICWR